MNKEIIIVGDKVLIEPDQESERTDYGLYLPQGVSEKNKVHSGKIIKTGPGYPVPDTSALDAEPWTTQNAKDKYFPLQAKEGDNCIYLKDAGIEIQFEKKKYVIVSHASILALIRTGAESE
jgi:chaperonin GroES